MVNCYEINRRHRLTLDYADRVRCGACGADGKKVGEPTNGGSHFYVCSRSGAPLGHSGV